MLHQAKKRGTELWNGLLKRALLKHAPVNKESRIYAPADDPIFREFPQWTGTVPPGYSVDFTGQITDLKFNPHNAGSQGKEQNSTCPAYPLASEEVFEWIHLLSSLLDAQERFVMFELGAGYGRWSIAAACALRMKRPTLPFHLTAVEAEPTHFQWLSQHFPNNGISSQDYRLIQAAVYETDGEVDFIAGHPCQYYGQAIVDMYKQPDFPEFYTVRVPTISLESLLGREESIDYLDMDIQGAELPVLKKGIDSMTRCVRRAFIATHSPLIDEELPKIFHSAGWYATAIYPSSAYPYTATSVTPFGNIPFVDGAQCWVNPTIK